jgi:hypothetical protein
MEDAERLHVRRSAIGLPSPRGIIMAYEKVITRPERLDLLEDQ